MSRIRQNYHAECEAAVNKQINMELTASYTYMVMASYFNRDQVALRGFAKFFHESTKEEQGHAEKLCKYQTKRGGVVQYEDIVAPTKQEWDSGLEAMEAALELEKNVNQSLLNLSKLAEKHGDSHLVDFVDEYLQEQVESMYEIGGYITNLQRVGPNLGEFEFDKMLLS